MNVGTNSQLLDQILLYIEIPRKLFLMRFLTTLLNPKIAV